MRIRWSVVAVLSGCFHPNAAFDVPCSSAGTCPDDQVCDTNQSPPLCVGALGDAGGPVTSDAPEIDAPINRTDARRPSDAGTDTVGVVPINFIQVNTVKPTTAATMLALGSPVTLHDAIIVCLNYPAASGATLTSIVDTSGNAYNTIVGPIDTGGEMHYVVFAQDVKSGTDALTVTLSAAPTGGSDLFALEYSGLAFTNAFDVSSNNSGTATAMTSGNATTTTADELIVGYAEAGQATAGVGFTSRATLSGNLVEDQIVSSIGSYSATATTTGAGGTWTMIMATFRDR